MGKLLTTFVFIVVALWSRTGECEIRKSGASFGNDKFVITVTAEPDGIFFVFPQDDTADFSLKSFDPNRLAPSKVSSFFLSINASGFFNSIHLFSGEKVSLGGDLLLKLNEATFGFIKRMPQPLLVILSEDSVIAFLGKVLVFNERYPALVKAIKDALNARGEDPYTFSLTGELVFKGAKVGARVGVESSDTSGCQAPDATYVVEKGGEKGTGTAPQDPPLALAPNIFFNLETRQGYSGSEDPQDRTTCLLTPIPNS